MNSTLLLVILSLFASTFLLANSASLANYNPRPNSCLPRTKAPYFQATAVINGKFNKVSLEDYKGKYLIVIFYPFDFTYVCPTELTAFSDSVNKFKEVNTEVIAISTDSHFTHLAWMKTPRNEGGVGELNIPLLADISKSISRNYGVLVEDEFDELYGAALRGLFIIDDKGIIRSVQINDAPVGRSVDETLRLVQAFQYAAEHGEVCPANWKPGSATIKPDQDLKREYFENAYKTDGQSNSQSGNESSTQSDAQSDAQSEAQSNEQSQTQTNSQSTTSNTDL